MINMGTAIKPTQNTLSPIFSIAKPEGPINVIPISSQEDENTEFSLKKPYPGCTASAPIITLVYRN
jgi:hypothetical protein